MAGTRGAVACLRAHRGRVAGPCGAPGGCRRDQPDPAAGRDHQCMSHWTWEYVPDAASVVGGLTPAQIDQVEGLAARIADAVRYVGSAPHSTWSKRCPT